MLDARARWKVSEAQEEAAARLIENLKLHPLVAKLLTIRGIVETEEARRFLQMDAGQFHDPFLLKGMKEAVEVIREALNQGKKLRVYGDYDADGISSTTLMTRLMERLGANFDTYIPHRVHEGYGLNKEAMRAAKNSGVDLIITVDTGISAREEIQYAKELGLEVVVTDHHEPPELLPEQAAAIINPKLPDCQYPFKHLAGVGVAFKLAHALLGEAPQEWLDITAVGTVADLMPLVGENRLIVKLGLERLRTTTNPGLLALYGVAGIDRTNLTETHIGFSLAPRINASGRLTHANQALKLLTTNIEQEAEHLAFELDQLNKERQKIVEEMTKEAKEQVEQRLLEVPDQRILLVAGEGWNVGVVGIVASKLLEKYYRPALVMAIDPDTGIAKGSARSIAGFDIHHALTACSDLLDHFGGHQAAAGLSLPRERLPELAARLEELAGQWLQEEDLTPIMQADITCSLAEAPLSCIEQLAMLAPFGNGNPSPKFVFEGVRITEKRTLGKEQQHLKLMLQEAAAEVACSMEAIGFGFGAAAPRIAPTSSLDVLGELSVNEWNGTRKPQLVISDLRIRQPQIFDWRGTRVGSSSNVPILPDDSGIVLFDRKAEDSLPRAWVDQGHPVWVAEETSEGCSLTGLNGAAGGIDFRALKDLVLYTLPPYEESLSQLFVQLPGLQRIYAVFADAHEGGAVSGILPDREAFKTIYAMVGREEGLPLGEERYWTALTKRTGLSRGSIGFILQVFEELGFVQRQSNLFRLVKGVPKRELAESRLYRRQLNRGQMEQLYIYSTAAELTSSLLSKLRKDG